MIDQKNEPWLRERYEALTPSQQGSYYLVSVKLKRFRNVNRVFGRAVGDALLEQVFSIIQSRLEAQEYAARICGCHFMLLLRESHLDDRIDYDDYSSLSVQFSQSEESMILRITDLVRAIRDIPDERFEGNIFTGLGLYHLPHEPMPYEIAKYNAELCRAESTENPHWNSHFEIYGVTYRDESAQAEDLRRTVLPAIERGLVKLYLQPKVDLITGQVTGAEALARWVDPKRGILPPSEFLPPLELNGMIRNLDLYLFGEVCKNIERWRNNFSTEIQVSVNLSKCYYNQHSFFPDYQNTFEQYQIPRHCIEIELLESIVLNDLTRLKKVVEEIRDYGFHCALDDFGSGFSSYSILSNARISTVKLDRSLFRDEGNWKEKVVIDNIIHMARTLDLKTVSEGIETPSYVDYLRSIGCDAVQGFVFYRPMPVEEFERRFVIGQERAWPVKP